MIDFIIKRVVIGDKEEFRAYTATENLHEWKDNPRQEDNPDGLKNHLITLGQFKPLIVMEDGTVLGGNMRLKRMIELGVKEVWITFVQPKNDQEKLEIALADNERAGHYIAPELNAVIKKYGSGIDLKNYTADFHSGVELDTIFKLASDHATDAQGKVTNTLAGKNKEVDMDKMEGELNAQCPKCGFKFKHE